METLFIQPDEKIVDRRGNIFWNITIRGLLPNPKPQDIKDLLMNKIITDNKDTVKVTGIGFHVDKELSDRVMLTVELIETQTDKN